jgi:hypothetical protein
LYASINLKYLSSIMSLMDSFHVYLKKQLIDYVESERKRGVPLDQIESVLLNAGHQKNIIDEVFAEIRQEAAGSKQVRHEDPVENDLVGQMKSAFKQFMSQSTAKEVKEAQADLKNTDTNEVIEEVIEEAEFIEEKTMLESMVFFGYFFFLGIAILFSAGGSDSSLASVAMGFVPAVISVFVSYMLLRMADNVPVYMFIPLGISSAFYAIGKFTPFPIFAGMDMEPLAIVNFLLGFAFNILIVYVRFIKPDHLKRRPVRRHHQQKVVAKPVQQRQEINELRREYRI